MTQAISIFDCLLLSVQSEAGTADYSWREPKPCSDKVTRVLGILDWGLFCSHIYILSAIIMAEEKEEVLQKATLWLQEREESLSGGFSVDYKGEEFIFVPKYFDR